MADWKDQYLAALIARDEIEKAERELYDHCTRLADRNATLFAKIRSTQSSGNDEHRITVSPSPPPPLVSYGFRRQTSPQPVNESVAVAQLRQDFTKAQQERLELEARLEKITKDASMLESRSKSDLVKLQRLKTVNTQLSTKLKDREEELRGKAKLLDDVQDENVTLNLQLNMAEDQAKKYQKENQELVDRWMARMGKEADKMNAEGNFS